jgi:hypothetical protein
VLGVAADGRIVDVMDGMLAREGDVYTTYLALP